MREIEPRVNHCTSTAHAWCNRSQEVFYGWLEYTCMYAKVWGGFCKRNNVETYLTKSWSIVWILLWVWPHYPTNSVIYSGKVLSQFNSRRTDWYTYIAWCHTFSQGKQKHLVPYTRGHVLGQDSFNYASNKCYLRTCLQCSEKGKNLLLDYNVKQPPQSSYDMHSAQGVSKHT